LFWLTWRFWRVRMARPGDFKILRTDPKSRARRATLSTAHGIVDLPVFMPVGTVGAVKTMSPAELDGLGVQILLGNAYHLNIRPGVDIVESAGGLHKFMGWDRPILTDSGGYQVFSLARTRKMTDNGVEFHSHVDGATIFMGPVEAMAIQRRLGSDIAMTFDECGPYPSSRDYTCQVVEKTISWAAFCAKQQRAEGQLVFGIVQGGEFADLRDRCARELVAMGFDGYAIGGVSVGEPEEILLQGMRNSLPALPYERPRYLMGVGQMGQMIEAIAEGIDMFDCVAPTRFARNGAAFLRWGRRYAVRNGEYKVDLRPIEEGCGCYACRNFTRAYIRHMLNVNEVLGIRMVTLHNLYRYMEFMGEIRAALDAGTFEEYRAEYKAMSRKECRNDGSI
jgi:queuine tRNA-ribosyltransferase